MKLRTGTSRRWLIAGVLAVTGTALTSATWSHGEHGQALAIAVCYAVAATVGYLWAGGSGDVAAVLRAGGDERQRAINVEAIAVMGLVLVPVIVIGGVVETIRTGSLGQYGLMGAVAGTTYAVSLAVLHRSRERLSRSAGQAGPSPGAGAVRASTATRLARLTAWSPNRS